MKGDFTRSTFQAVKHYSGVRLQQGRVQVDADWNEQVDIQAHRDETTGQDTVGRCGAPLHQAGFEITAAGGNLRIGAGRYYVDGILCENEQDVTVGVAPVVDSLPRQPDLETPTIPSPANPGTYVAYLDVWPRHITPLEDPSIREVALGGPDTAHRIKTVWQVKLQQVSSVVDNSIPCSQFHDGWVPDGVVSTGRLRAQGQPGEAAEGPCVVPPGAGFRRLENQLYRVEIHAGSDGAGTPTFKWSRDNGSIVTRLLNITGNDLTVADTGRDAVLGFAAGQWVELNDEPRTLRGEPGILVELAAVEGSVLTISAWPDAIPLTLASFGTKPTVRRWDSEGALQVTAGAFIDLEDGMQVEFDAGAYRTGDYWMIPARSLTGIVEWPLDDTVTPPQPRFEARHGIGHHYCALALLGFDGTAWSVLSDCRTLFPPLTEVSALHYVGGDGQEAMPDLTQPVELVPLAQPLEVGVANRVGAQVRFSIVEGNGRLAGGGSVGPSVDVPTGEDGIAACTWALDPATQSQQVEARLLDDGGTPLPLPVRFNANLSVASEVAYVPPAACLGLQGHNTVQAAIDRLAQLPSLRHAGGDGQEAPPTDLVLPQRLRVSVVRKCGPVVGAQVVFTALDGGEVAGSPESAGPPTIPAGATTTATVTTDADGIAACGWRLANDPSRPRQRVSAQLVVPVGQPPVPPVRFTAGLSLASRVGYAAPAACASVVPELATATTVQQAIDLLCQRSDRGEEAVRIRRIDLRAPSVELRNDSDIPLPQLAQGIRVVCDRPLVESTAAGRAPSFVQKPTCYVTVYMPFPITDSERQLWGAHLIGFEPVVLSASVSVEAIDRGSAINWVPAEQILAWLRNLLTRIQQFQLGNSVLAVLALKGNFIWTETTVAGATVRQYLDGEAFGVLEGPRTRLDLSQGSGDGRRGGTFEMWFRVVLPKTAEKTPKDVDKVPDKITDKIAEVKVTDVPITPTIAGPPAEEERGEAEGRPFIPPDERPEVGPPAPEEPRRARPRARRRRKPT